MNKIFSKIYLKFSSNVTVGPRGLQPSPNTTWAQNPCRGDILPRTNGQWPMWRRERLRTYPILGIPELQ